MAGRRQRRSRLAIRGRLRKLLARRLPSALATGSPGRRYQTGHDIGCLTIDSLCRAVRPRSVRPRHASSDPPWMGVGAEGSERRPKGGCRCLRWRDQPSSRRHLPTSNPGTSGCVACIFVKGCQRPEASPQEVDLASVSVARRRRTHVRYRTALPYFCNGRASIPCLPIT